MHSAAREWARAHLPQGYRSVLEVGSLDINGGVRDLLDPRASYLGIDVQPGPGVDVVTDFATYTHPTQVDLILCLEVFEHTQRWRELIAAAARNLTPGGTFIATCAGPGRPPHSARSERPIEPDEWYENLDAGELASVLRPLFSWAQVNTQGLDLRCVARKEGAARLVPLTEMTDQRQRVVIATPMQETCQAAFCVSLANAIGATLNEAPDLSLEFDTVVSSVLPMSRQMLATRALESGATHILWVDSDIEFPPDALLRLMGHDLDMVGANYIGKRPPFSPTARRGGQRVHTTPHSGGLERVDGLGFGFVLVKADVFRKLSLPWFAFEWDGATSTYIGEDFRFCDRAREAGFSLYIDHDLSKEINHVGSFQYNAQFLASAPDFM